MEAEKQEVRGTVWLWTGVGAVVGGLLGMVVAGPIPGAIGAGVVGFLAHRSSSKNGGSAPSWLCRSKKK